VIASTHAAIASSISLVSFAYCAFFAVSVESPDVILLFLFLIVVVKVEIEDVNRVISVVAASILSD